MYDTLRAAGTQEQKARKCQEVERVMAACEPEFATGGCDSPSQTSSFQSSTLSTSSTPLDVVAQDRKVTITVGGCKKARRMHSDGAEAWLKNRRSLVGGNTLKVTGSKSILIERRVAMVHFHENAVRAGVVPTVSAPPLFHGPLQVPVNVVTPPVVWNDDSALLMEKAPVVSEDTLFTHLQVSKVSVCVS